MSERDRDLLVELDAAGIAPFNLRVQAGLLPQGLFPARQYLLTYGRKARQFLRNPPVHEEVAR